MKRGSLDSLQRGQTLLVAFKATKNPAKVQVEIAEKIRVPNPLEAFNTSDPAFGRSRARRAWQTYMAEDVKRIWPELATEVDKALKSKTGQPVEVNVLNPSHPEFGQLHIKVTEQTVGELMDAYDAANSTSGKANIAYQLENLPTRAKRAGADGPYLTYGGEPIVSNTSIEFGDQSARHRFLVADGTRSSIIEGISMGLNLVDEEEEEVVKPKRRKKVTV